MKRTTTVCIALLLCVAAWADEGMWMINAINSALEKKMQERGLLLSARDIYDADAEGATLADAVVSLEFSCTGSIISDKGLLITNHHCAYSDVFGLSTTAHNYLEDGFWAMNSSDEICIPDKKALLLKKVIDVTDEANAMIEEAQKTGTPMGIRRLGYLMEKKYSSESGLEAWFSSMWKGSRYYISLYKVYRDVRLVAAPPVSMAAFGGDIDNWEWPQHKCDFALYRIYTAPDGNPAGYSPENVPLCPEKKLEISLDGYRPGDFTMVLGFPGRTDRYSSSFKLDFEERVSLPVSNEIRAHQMSIINGWMNADPAVRLKYSDYYFSLSNVQEMNEGQVQCYGRFGTVACRQAQEERMQEWIDASPAKERKYGDLLEQIAMKRAATESILRNTAVYRETLVRGTNLSRYASRIISLGNNKDSADAFSRLPGILKGIRKDYCRYDMRVEKDLFRYAFVKYFSDIDPQWTGTYQKELVSSAFCRNSSRADNFSGCATENHGGSCGGCAAGDSKSNMAGNHGCGHYRQDRLEAIADSIWTSSFMTDSVKFDAFAGRNPSLSEYLDDPFLRFLGDVRIMDFNRAREQTEGKPDLTSLEKDYTHVLYQMRQDEGREQYPDANSTMRITYGTVGPIEPYDAVLCSWQSTASGILEKHDPSSYEFSLGARQEALLEAEDWGRWGISGQVNSGQKQTRGSYLPINFLTDNDITGGNSGSPVLNARGQLIGLAFDGNKESLASDAMYVDGYNKCVCVDIRYVLWALDRYAGMSRILEELGL